MRGLQRDREGRGTTSFHSDVLWELVEIPCERPCQKCGGSGHLLTELGKKMLEFIARHMQLGNFVDRLRVVGCDAPKNDVTIENG